MGKEEKMNKHEKTPAWQGWGNTRNDFASKSESTILDYCAFVKLF